LENHKVVIVGGVFGGFTAREALEERAGSNHALGPPEFHLFQAPLYQVATGTLAREISLFPCVFFLKRQANAERSDAEVVHFDVKSRTFCSAMAEKFLTTH